MFFLLNFYVNICKYDCKSESRLQVNFVTFSVRFKRRKVPLRICLEKKVKKEKENRSVNKKTYQQNKKHKTT